MNNRVAVYRKEHFNAAHRLYNPAWDEKTNYAVFGKCANPNYHGHNYDLVVKVTGVVNKDTGYVMDMKELSDIIKDNVLDEFDHKNLNMDVSFFKELTYIWLFTRYYPKRLIQNLKYRLDSLKRRGILLNTRFRIENKEWEMKN